MRLVPELRRWAQEDRLALGALIGIAGGLLALIPLTALSTPGLLLFVALAPGCALLLAFGGPPGRGRWVLVPLFGGVVVTLASTLAAGLSLWYPRVQLLLLLAGCTGVMAWAAQRRMQNAVIDLTGGGR